MKDVQNIRQSHPNTLQLLRKRRRSKNFWPSVFAPDRNAIEVDLATRRHRSQSTSPSFLANDSRARLRIARRYYAPARAKQFANASIGDDCEIVLGLVHSVSDLRTQHEASCVNSVSNSGRWSPLSTSAMTWGSFRRPGRGLELRTLRAFAIDELSCYASPEFCPLHSNVTPTRSSHRRSGNYLRICKSVPEPFHQVPSAFGPWTKSKGSSCQTSPPRRRSANV